MRNRGKESPRPADPYWSTLWEMLARAFELYVVDKLAENEVRNDYLMAERKSFSNEADAAETKAQVDRERDYFGLDGGEGNASNVGQTGWPIRPWVRVKMPYHPDSAMVLVRM